MMSKMPKTIKTGKTAKKPTATTEVASVQKQKDEVMALRRGR